jgi:hypothetical protein
MHQPPRPYTRKSEESAKRGTARVKLLQEQSNIAREHLNLLGIWQPTIVGFVSMSCNSRETNLSKVSLLMIVLNFDWKELILRGYI